jgi:Transposase IS66 family
MQESCGVPVSESVMFERSEQVADQVLPVYLALKKEAANGEVIHTDDTAIKILSCLIDRRGFIGAWPSRELPPHDYTILKPLLSVSS